jgi:hypothetical protein
MRYIIGFLVTIGLIILAFVLLLRNTGPSSGASGPLDITKYASTATEVRFTVDGPINANQTHQQVRITVGRDDATIEIISGYQGQVSNMKNYPNNSTAYANFLAALQRANFTKGNTDPANADERGYCPAGDRYIYEVVSGDQDKQRYWSTSCGVGTFKGDKATVNSLFVRQIPDYDQLTSIVQL